MTASIANTTPVNSPPTHSTASNQSYDLMHWLMRSSMTCSLTELRPFLLLITSYFWSHSIAEKGEWRSLARQIWQLISIGLWGALILVVLSSFGRYFVADSPTNAAAQVATYEVKGNQFKEIAVAPIEREEFRAEVNTALTAAREAALSLATTEVNDWISSLMTRVDNPQNDADFLDWYFGYWTQQKFGLEAILQAGTRVFNQNAKSAKDKVQAEVLQEFTNRVLRPEIAKLELKNIARDIADIYIFELQQSLEKIRIKYSIPEADWNEYLENVSLFVTDIDGRQVPLKLKALTVASLGGGALLTKATVVAIEKVTAKIGTKAVAKAGASMLGKAGALIGGELLGPAVTVAIIAWDAIDIHNTEVTHRPILKDNIEDYFNQVKKDILGDEGNGIKKVILDIENSVNRGILGIRLPSFNRP